MSISVKTETLPIGVVPKNSIILLALTLGAFVVGSSEFMVGGLLNQIAADLNVPVPSAGLLITGYAAGVTVGGPLVTILTGRRSQAADRPAFSDLHSRQSRLRAFDQLR